MARAGDVLTIAPDPDGRPTWVLRACRGLGVTTRIPVPPAMLGRWPAELDGEALAIDTAGPDRGRRAAEGQREGNAWLQTAQENGG